MADILIVDWYPIETASNGCSRTGLHYIGTGPKHFTNVKNTVARKTPGTPVWLMAQTHKNLAPRCHKKAGPTEALLRRQVRDAFRYLGASGIAFHTWSNTTYARDQRRSPDDRRLDAYDRQPGPHQRGPSVRRSPAGASLPRKTRTRARSRPRAAARREVVLDPPSA